MRRRRGPSSRKISKRLDAVSRLDEKRRQSWWITHRDDLATLSTIIVVPAIFVTLLVGYLSLHDQRAHEIREDADQRIAAARSQAEQISAVPGDGSGGAIVEPKHSEAYTPITMSNRSATPVYDVIVSLVLIQGGGAKRANELDKEQKLMNQEDFSTLPPGTYEARVSAGWGGMMARPGAEIAFTDSAGRSWVRYASGQLVRLPQEPVAYYHLDTPIGWEIPRALR